MVCPSGGVVSPFRYRAGSGYCRRCVGPACGLSSAVAFHSCVSWLSVSLLFLWHTVIVFQRVFCRRGWLRPRNFLCSLPVVPCLCLSRAKRRIVGAAWYIRMADFNYPRLLPGCSEPTILHYMLYEGGNTLREGGRGADTAAGAWNRTKAYAKTVCRCGNRRSRLMRFLARPSPSCRVIPVRGMSGSAAFPSNRKPPLPNVFVYSVFDVDFFLFG